MVYRDPYFMIYMDLLYISVIPGWWLNQPLLKNMFKRQVCIIFPKLGFNNKKVFETITQMLYIYMYIYIHIFTLGFQKTILFVLANHCFTKGLLINKSRGFVIFTV